MPTTAEKPTTNESARAMVATLAQQADTLRMAAEEILFATPEDQPIEPQDAEILRMAGIREHDDFKRERDRIRSVKGHLAKAGSKKEFNAAKKTLDAAVERERKERPALEQKLREIEAALRSLETERQQAEMKYQQMFGAREALTSLTLIPRFARERYEHARRIAKQPLNGQVANLESRLTVIKELQTRPYDSKEVLEYAKRNAPEVIDRKTVGQYIDDSVNQARWAKHLAELQTEYVASEKKFRELKAQLDGRLAETKRLLTYYVDRIE